MFAYFHDMLRVGRFIEKKWHKTGNFRDPEGAIFIVGTQNLSYMILLGCL